MKTVLGSGLFRYPGLLLAGASAYSMSTLFSALKPVLLARFIEEAGFSESMAGLLVAMPFVGIACASLIVNVLIRNFSVQGLIQVFGAILVGSELISAWSYTQAGVILALQFACGIAVGVLMGATSKIIATREVPGPIFGFVDMIAVLSMSAMIFGAGLAVGSNGLKGGYLFAAATALVLTVLMQLYRTDAQPAREATDSSGRLPLSLRAFAIVAMAVVFVSASGLGFAFMFAIAIKLGMSYESAGSFIGVLLFVSAAGCIAGGWAAAKFGPRRPLAAAYVICGASWMLAIHAPTPLVFMCALTPAIFALQFNYPILLTLSGSLDDQGLWAAIATPLQASGFAWAAIIAGFLVGHRDVEVLGIATVIGMLLCLALLWLARESASPPKAATEPA